MMARALAGSRVHRLDAIVVGSGFAGMWAAKGLAEAGVHTLVLEAGPPRTASEIPRRFPGTLDPGSRVEVDTPTRGAPNRNLDGAGSGNREVEERGRALLLNWFRAKGQLSSGVVEGFNGGCPQGSPLSPMLSNIVLHVLDHHLESRNLGYARWADDFVLVVRSERAAHRVMDRTIRFWSKSSDYR